MKSKSVTELSGSIVSCEWLNENLHNSDILIFDATLPKAVDVNTSVTDRVVIKNSRFFDIKNVFSNVEAPFPNTMLSNEIFEEKARELGINSNSVIVVYDRYGYYSAPRVWWMFKAMGFHNVAVLDGGLPLWLEMGYPIQNEYTETGEFGDFIAEHNIDLIHGFNEVLQGMNDVETVILDARSYDRYIGIAPEPRKGLRSGHIPNSKSMPYTSLLSGVQLKSEKELKELFAKYSEKHLIFSCGSGITACILALGAEIAEVETKSVYDGSWTEWGSLKKLPIEKG